MKRIGLIDVDGHNFPNLPLMKLAAWHKSIGDEVEWYEPMLSGHKDIVYLSKVFTFTQDYQYPVDADVVVRGGTGYDYPSGGEKLPDEIEHIYPDYSIYYDRIPRVKDTAYGFLTRGCPRACDFCIVGEKEGRHSQKVADLKEFWRGQKNIVLLDPNFFACKDWRHLSEQLVDSGAYIDFTQGVDIRIMTEEMASHLLRMKIKKIHFAWDNYNDKYKVCENLKMFKTLTGYGKDRMTVYILTNYNSTHEEDLDRVYTLAALGYTPYIMIYDKHKLPQGHVTKRLQRWVNNKFLFHTVKNFKDYR